MSIATARIAGAAGMTMAGTPTMLNIRVGQSSSGTFVIPAAKTPAASALVDWGDGTVESFTPDSNGWIGVSSSVAHTYAAAGDYVVTLDRSLTYVAFGMRNGGSYPDSPGMVMSIVQWGEDLFPDSIWTDSTVGLLVDAGIVLFAGCSNLEGPLPARQLAAIPKNAFKGAAKLADPSPLVGSGTTIAQAAFADSGVTGTSWWPSGQTMVPDNCFRDARRLASLSGLSAVTAVGGAAFAGCSSLTSLSGLSSNASTLWLGDSCFEGCTGLTSLSSFPRAATVIPKRCFAGCVGLQTEGIRLPSQTDTISAQAFAGVGASEIVFGESVALDGSIPSGDQAHPSQIDQTAFIGQASAPPNGPRPKLIMPHLSPSDIRGIMGADALGHVYGTQEVTLTDNTPSARNYSWFTIMPTSQGYVPVSWAPWGAGPDWQIVTSASQDTPHEDVICALFVKSTENDTNIPENLRNRNYGTSSAPDWLTRLELLADVQPNNPQSMYVVNFNFSPYSDPSPTST